MTSSTQGDRFFPLLLWQFFNLFLKRVRSVLNLNINKMLLWKKIKNFKNRKVLTLEIFFWRISITRILNLDFNRFVAQNFWIWKDFIYF